MYLWLYDILIICVQKSPQSQHVPRCPIGQLRQVAAKSTLSVGPQLRRYQMSMSSSFHNEFAKQLPEFLQDFRTRELSIPQPPLRSLREEMHLPFSGRTSGMSIRPPDTNQQITRKWYMRESVKHIKSFSTLNLTKQWNIPQLIATWNICEIASSLRRWHGICLDFKLTIMAITWTPESTSDHSLNFI